MIDGGDGNDIINVTEIKSGFFSIDGDNGSYGNCADDTINIGIISGGSGNINGDLGNSGTGNDVINITAITGGSAWITGGHGADSISIGAISGGIHGISGDYDTSVGGLGVSDFNDTISIGAVNGAATVSAYGNGGNDAISLSAVSGTAKVSVYGGAGNDAISLGNVATTTAGVVIDGGDGNDSLYYTGTSAVNMSLAANGNISAISMGGTKVNISTTGIEYYQGTSANDTFTAGNVSTNLTLHGGDGNDSIQIDAITGGTVYLNGGGGTADTLYLNSTAVAQGQKIVLNSAGVGTLSYYNVNTPATTTSVNANITGFEHYKGNNIGNVMDASAYTISGITLEGGAGADTLIGHAGQVLRGGAGEDLLVLKSVTGGAVSVDGGAGKDMNFAWSDTLRFENTEAMRATLNAANFGSTLAAGIFTSLSYINGANTVAVTATATGIEAIEFGSGADSISISGTGSYYVEHGRGQ